MVYDICANLLYSPHTKQGRNCTPSNYFATAPTSNDRYFIVKVPWSPINSNPTPMKHYMSDTNLLLALTYTAHATSMAYRPISHCKIIIRLPIHIISHKYSHARIRSFWGWFCQWFWIHLINLPVFWWVPLQTQKQYCDCHWLVPTVNKAYCVLQHT